MGNFEVDKLINEIYIRPAIWDMRTNDYSNKLKKQSAWEEVTHAFIGEDAEEEEKIKMGSLLKKKWKNIRDRYSREVKGHGQKSKNGYMYTNQLAFLTDIIQHGPSDLSIDDTYPSSPFEDTKEDAPEYIEIGKTPKMDVEEPTLVEALKSHRVRQKRKKLDETASEDEDDDRLFLLSLLPFLKSLPPQFKFAARIDLMQTLNKYLSD